MIMRNRKIIPLYLFNESERLIIKNNFDYKEITVIQGGKKVPCLEFYEDALDILDEVDTYMLCEASTPTAEERGLAMRMSTIAFQCIRELAQINGKSLSDIAFGVKTIGRLVALAVTVGMANLDVNYARRLLPLIRAV